MAQSIRPNANTVPTDIPSQEVKVITHTENNTLQFNRSLLSALIAGLGALAAAATGEAITLQGYLTAAAAAAAAAGAVYGVRANGGSADTTISDSDMRRLKQGARHK